MQAAVAWKRLFTHDYLKRRYLEKVMPHPSVGLDKTTNRKFGESLDENIDLILRKVNSGTYSFTRYKMLLFSKGPNKYPRQICVPTVRDKLTLSVLNELIYQVYGDSCKTEMPQVLINRISQELPRFDAFIKIDISSFYASIQHDILIRLLKRKIKKTEIISLIQKSIENDALTFPVKEKVSRVKRDRGIPEGLPISNSLANIFLSAIDRTFSDNPKILFIRYVDDILVLLNESDIDQVKRQLIYELQKIGLNTNDKSLDGRICNGFEYLGYYISTQGISVRTSSKLKVEQSLEELINSFKNHSKEYILWKLNLRISGFIYGNNKYGWMFFFSQITDESLLYRLDSLVNQLILRQKLDEDISPKRFVRAYFEIKYSLHNTSYIPNFDKYSLDDKRELLTRIYHKDCSKASESVVHDLFNNIIAKEIRDIEKDVQAFS